MYLQTESYITGNGKYVENTRLLAKSRQGTRFLLQNNSSGCRLSPMSDVRYYGGLFGRALPFPVPLGPESILLRLLGGKTYGLESISVLLKDFDMNALHERGRYEGSIDLIHGECSGLKLGYLVSHLAQSLTRTSGVIRCEGRSPNVLRRLAHVPPDITVSRSIWVWVIRVLPGGGSYDMCRSCW